MDLTIVIVNYNSTKFLINCLSSIKESLYQCRISYEVIVVDNGSRAKDKRTLKKILGIKVIFNQKNLGFGVACNQGINKARGKYILLLNPDVIVLGKAIKKLIFFLKDKRGFVGGKLFNRDFSIQPSCGLFFNLLVVFMILFLKGEKLGITKFSPTKVQKVDWVSGACLAGRKNDFLKIGGFDKQIFLYTEEVDLLFRARKKGLYCYFCPEAGFVHLGAAIAGHYQSVINIFKGLVYFYKKHYPAFNVFILKFLLYIKAVIGIVIGIITFNREIRSKYRLTINYI